VVGTKPSEKDAKVKMGSSFPNGGEHYKTFETTTQGFIGEHFFLLERILGFSSSTCPDEGGPELLIWVVCFNPRRECKSPNTFSSAET